MYSHCYIRTNTKTLTTYSIGTDPKVDVGPVISPKALKRIIHLIESGEKDGVEVLLDGRGITVNGYEKGNFIGPTYLHNVTVSV